MKKLLMLMIGLTVAFGNISCDKGDNDSMPTQKKVENLSVTGNFAAAVSNVELYITEGGETYVFDVTGALLNFPSTKTKNGDQVDTYLELKGLDCLVFTGGMVVKNLGPSSLKLTGTGSNYLDITYISSTSLGLNGVIDGVVLNGTLASFNGSACVYEDKNATGKGAAWNLNFAPGIIN